MVNQAQISKLKCQSCLSLGFWILFAIGILAFGIFYDTALGATPDELRQAIEEKSKNLQEINAQIETTQKALEQTQAAGKTLKKETQKLDSQLNQVELGIRSSKVLIDKLNLEIESTSYEIDDVEKNIATQKEAIGELLREAQEKSDESPLIIFLKNKSLAESVSEMQDLSNISNELSNKVQEMQGLKKQLNENLDKFSSKKQSTEGEHYNLKNKEKILGDVKEEKKTLLTQNKNQEKVYQQNLTDLQKLQEEIADEIDKYEEELRLKIDPLLLPAGRPGVLGLPVPLPPARLTQEWGSTSFVRSQGRTWHNGLDFGAPIGTPIFAAEDGTVIATGDQDNYRINGKRKCYKGAYGKFVLVKHEKINLTTLYTHLSLWSVRIGEKVKRGEVIGYVGNTGRSTGPHLHFTVYDTKTIPPATPGFPEGTRSSRVCGPLPVGGDLNPQPYLNL